MAIATRSERLALTCSAWRPPMLRHVPDQRSLTLGVGRLGEQDWCCTETSGSHDWRVTDIAHPARASRGEPRVSTGRHHPFPYRGGEFGAVCYSFFSCEEARRLGDVSISTQQY